MLAFKCFRLQLSVHSKKKRGKKGKRTQNNDKKTNKPKTYNLHPYYMLIHLFMNHHHAS